MLTGCFQGWVALGGREIEAKTRDALSGRSDMVVDAPLESAGLPDLDAEEGFEALEDDDLVAATP